MDLQILNTESKEKEVFVPIDERRVKMYHCGPTVYWTQHIGNMRAVVMADVIVRTLRYFEYDVTFVRNFTDVGHLSGDNDGDADTGEDRMEKGARREGVGPLAIAQKYIDIYERDVAFLNVLAAEFKPRATEHVQEIIDMIEDLFIKKYAYKTDLAVYFDTSKARDYYRLSGQNTQENRAGAGVGDVSDPNKKRPEDFALWFFRAGTHKNALQYWPSPFESPLVENGNGFPGWHIECSAMIKKYLGDTIDIHMGGIEHIPVHHTNEIAQSEAVSEKQFVHYWIHNEHLLVDNAKMSKSEGTAYSLQEVREKGFDPLSLRYFFLQSHYRSKQNFTWDALQAAQNGLEGLYRSVASFGGETGTINKEYKTLFQQALANDFNTPRALAVVSEVIKSAIPNVDKKATILDFDQVLGLKIEENIEESSKDTTPKEVLELLEKRKEAREGRDYETSDKLRDKIKTLGYEVIDTDEGMKVQRSK